MRGCKTNDEKAIAIYNFMRLMHYHCEYPSEPGGITVLKEINCYGWSLCGGLRALTLGECVACTEAVSNHRCLRRRVCPRSSRTKPRPTPHFENVV